MAVIVALVFIMYNILINFCCEFINRLPTKKNGIYSTHNFAVAKLTMSFVLLHKNVSAIQIINNINIDVKLLVPLSFNFESVNFSIINFEYIAKTIKSGSITTILIVNEDGVSYTYNNLLVKSTKGSIMSKNWKDIHGLKNEMEKKIMLIIKKSKKIGFNTISNIRFYES